VQHSQYILSNFEILKSECLEMIKNLINISKTTRHLSTLNVFNRNLASNSKTTVKNEADAEFEYQSDKSSGIRNLEKIGLAKQSWSWPQYNRVIYPPTEDGKPMINPVSILFKFDYFI